MPDQYNTNLDSVCTITIDGIQVGEVIKLTDITKLTLPDSAYPEIIKDPGHATLKGIIKGNRRARRQQRLIYHKVAGKEVKLPKKLKNGW